MIKPLPAAAEGGARVPASAEDFSLVLGGPLYQLLLRTRLAHPHLDLLRRRMLVIPALAWLPLLALTMMEGNAVGGVSVPFLADIETYARFLVAMPLLLLAEIVAHRRMNGVIRQFRERDIVPREEVPRFEAAISAAMRMRNSLVAEIALLAIVLLLGPWTWRHGLALPTDTWYASVGGGRVDLTRAGWWFIYVSVPIFQFLLLRWYFRLAIWWRFMWQVSRIPLKLSALHSDRVGGLGFLDSSAFAFMPVLFAQGVVLSGIIASRVLSNAHSALEYRGEVGVLIILLVVVVIGPMLFFHAHLDDTRRDGLCRLGAFATTFAHDFERKWLAARLPDGEPLVGSPDISSLADLAGASDATSGMRTLPFSLRTVLRLIVATSIPFFPLVLTVIPFGELVLRVVEMML